MEKTKINDQPEPKPFESFKEIKEQLEIQSSNLDLLIKKAPPQSVDAKFTYLFQANMIMGNILHATLEMLEKRYDNGIQIAREADIPRR